MRTCGANLNVTNPGSPGFAHFGHYEIMRLAFESRSPLVWHRAPWGKENFPAGKFRQSCRRLTDQLTGVARTFLQESFGGIGTGGDMQRHK